MVTGEKDDGEEWACQVFVAAEKCIKKKGLLRWPRRAARDGEEVTCRLAAGRYSMGNDLSSGAAESRL